MLITLPDFTSQSVALVIRGMPGIQVHPMPAIERHIPVTKTSSIVLNRTSIVTAMIRNAALFEITYP